MLADRPSLDATLTLLREGSLAAAAGVGRDAEAVLVAARAVESRLGVRLFAFAPGSPDRIEATADGRRFLHRAPRLLAEERQFLDAFQCDAEAQSLRVLCSHYLASYLLIEIIGRYLAAHPALPLRLSVRTEQQILGALLQGEERAVGFAAPVDFPEEVRYTHWFDLQWALVVPCAHRFATPARAVSLQELAQEKLILFEPGSTGRQHVLEALHAAQVRVSAAMQATGTGVIVQMVEAGLGVAILPLLASGRVTAGHAVRVVPLVESVQPIQSGILVANAWAEDPQILDLIAFVRAAAI
ncbi:MAG: hypothetical protein HYV17_09520 [Xanthomonadales bacterium]|nr:hypothetical protein [Xanthomonadales bacterium]